MSATVNDRGTDGAFGAIVVLVVVDVEVVVDVVVGNVVVVVDVVDVVDVVVVVLVEVDVDVEVELDDPVCAAATCVSGPTSCDVATSTSSNPVLMRRRFMF